LIRQRLSGECRSSNEALAKEIGQPGHAKRPSAHVGYLADDLGTKQRCQFLAILSHFKSP